MIFLLIIKILLLIVFGHSASAILSYIYSWAHNADVWKKIENKWVLVINANTVVGATICRNLAAKGCRLILTGTNTDALIALRDSLLPLTNKVVYFNVDYPNQRHYSFLDEYDIGLVINKIGFYEAEPTHFTDSDLDLFLDFNIRGPLFILKAAIDKMALNNQGYVVTLSIRFGDKPRAYYALITAAKSMFQSWSKSMYYEVKDSKVVLEYMETGSVSLTEEDATLLSPSINTIVKCALGMFGSSYYTIPYFIHFGAYYFFLKHIPEFIVAAYRNLRIKRFAKQNFMLF